MSAAISQPAPRSLPAWLDREAYPFEHRYARLPAGRMHYVDTGGGGPVILFVHGTPTWSFEYRHLITSLRDRYRCIAPDHMGFGLSERPSGLSYSPEEHAENLRDFVHAIGLKEFTLVVHDFGGPIGLPLALDADLSVDRIVYLNTWMWSFANDASMMNKARIAASFIGRFLYRWLNFSLRVIVPAAYGDRRKLTPAIHRQYLSVFPDRESRQRVLWALARALVHSGAHYESLWEARRRLANKKSLVVWGMRDGAFPPRMLDRLTSALEHPVDAARRPRVVKLPGAGHWPHEEEAETVSSSVSEFLREPTR